MDIKNGPVETVLAAVNEVFPGRPFVSLHQDHTRIVHRCDDPAVRGKTGDGLVAGETDSVLGVTVADCLPIFLFDPATGTRGVLHSGWKGTGILENALRILFEDYRVQAENLLVTAGPCIGPCCYDVDEERAGIFLKTFGSGSAIFRDGRWSLDLKAANRNILERCGVERFLDMKLCTRCDERFGSFRRQGTPGFTRMLALIG